MECTKATPVEKNMQNITVKNLNKYWRSNGFPLWTIACLLFLLTASFASAAGTVAIKADSATIRCMVFDNSNRLWIGTFGHGLWRKDGNTISKFHDQTSQQPFPMINNLLLDGNNLWIATAGGGCVCLDTTSLRFTAIEQQPGFAKLHALMKTTSGKLLIGSVGSGSAYLANQGWQPVRPEQPINLAWVNSIVEWNNRLWLGTSTGLYANSLDIENWQPQATGLNRGINTMLVYDNRLYIGTTSRGVFFIEGDSEARAVSGTLGDVHCLVAHPTGLYAVGSDSLWRISGSQAELIDAPFDNGKSAVVDDKKNLLIGTTDGKIYRSENGIDYILTIAFNGNGFEEQAK